MKIALDFDGTFTEDPELWIAFVENCFRRGHEVIVVTMRTDVPSEADEVHQAFETLNVEIFFTNREAKLTYMAKMNIHPDVWIDDKPFWLFRNG